MDVNKITIDEIKSAITQIFRFEVIEETDEIIKYNIQSDTPNKIVVGVLNKTHVNSIINDVNDNFNYEELCLYNNKCYEVLVQRERRIIPTREIRTNDETNKVYYILDKPSEKYILYFLHQLHISNTNETYRRLRISRHSLSRYFEENMQPTLFNEGNHELNIIDVIQTCVISLQTVQIHCNDTKDKTKQELEILLYAFLFCLGYNTDNTVTPYRYMEEFIAPYRIRRRRFGHGDFDAPRRKYNNELVLHYQKGISSDNVDHNYLSFYHILEYYFESIYNDDIIKSVRNELTKPSFSYKRKNDIDGLVKIIKKKLQYKNEEFSINESEALELVLRKFIPDLSELKAELGGFSSDAVDFYKVNEVSFSKGNKVNFDIENSSEIYKNLAQRIYKTRNSIVHSKEMGKSKYTPFKDDKELSMEIYLIRVIAELVIIADSSEI